ncbi:MAG: hypothetical protein AUI14_08855 [Actinobacteria bacterium 13_2_20CM_2_71_6]|nr:MAG: hypothetical protein AUI14_08855 [Actinobacteria bacterium 13_2_20CM_2_71_6]
MCRARFLAGQRGSLRSTAPKHGIEPDAVTNVEAAWAAFGEFLQTPVNGIVSADDSDADGFIVQWGRWSWNDKRPSLSFTRQLAVPDANDPGWQPSYWHVELEMTFQDEPSLVGLDALNESNSGFSFEPIGPARGVELTVTHDHYLGLYPQLQAIWRATPTGSKLSLYQAD